MRWFCPRVIDSADALDTCLREASSAQRRHGASRTTLRVLFAAPPGPGIVTGLQRSGYRVEARMPLSDGRVVAYLARNLPARLGDARDAAAEDELVNTIVSTPAQAPGDLTRAFSARRDLDLQHLDARGLDARDRRQLIAMHREAFPTFPYDFAEKLQLMLDNPAHYLLCGVRSRNDGELYAFSNLEITGVTLDDGSTIRLAEYDNTMRRGISGRADGVAGIAAIIRLSLAQLASQANIDLCHGESRAGLAAINRISHAIGMQYGGKLQQHLLIAGKRDIEYRQTPRFESMNVWYLNRAHLAALRPPGA